MLANYDYYCPNCDARLTSNKQIHFLVCIRGFEMANLYLSATPGEYGHKSDHDLKIKNGDRVEFHCTSCRTNLKSKNYPDFVEIHLKVTPEVVFEVLFSPVCGEKTTYVIMENEMVTG